MEPFIYYYDSLILPLFYFIFSPQCEPLHGWGFRRGGYQCVCQPGYRYPPWQFGPFQGIEVESATEEEYENGFDCYSVERKYLA